MPVITPGSTTVGAVQISGLAPAATPIESWLNGILTGKAFAIQLSSTAVAAQLSYVEMRNPTGSGKNAWVYIANGFAATASQLVYSITAPPLLGGGFHGVSMLTGALTSLAFVAASSSATIPGQAFANYPAPALGIAGQTQPWVIVVPANTGLVLCLNNVNIALTTNIMWMEV